MRRRSVTYGTRFGIVVGLASLVALALAAPGGSSGGELGTQSVERVVPVEKGLRVDGRAYRLSGGPLFLRKGKEAFLRFSVPQDWEGSQVTLVLDPVTTSSKGFSLRQAKVDWRRGAPRSAAYRPHWKPASSGTTLGEVRVRLRVTTRLLPGSSRDIRVSSASGGKIGLRRVPYLVRKPAEPKSGATLVAGGDIACSPDSPAWNAGVGTATECRQAETAGLVRSFDDAVLSLGDNQYPNGALNQYRLGFGASWGDLSNVLHPTPGNHEYMTPGAEGYFDYFAELGVETGGPDRGYYAFDVGSWTLLSLNSNCEQVPCAAGSPQEVWLREELEKARGLGRCTLAFWHHPVASGGEHGDTPKVLPLWRAFHELGGDALLTAHDHDYQRFRQLGPDTQPSAEGPLSWVVGTGGKSLRETSKRAGVRAVIDGRFGLLRVFLRDGSFSWKWLGLTGAQSDFGSTQCRA